MISKVASLNFALVMVMVTTLSGSLISPKTIDLSFATIQTDTNANTDQVVNINASSVFDTRRMVLGNNIENLVVLIPNEGHHGPQENEDRFLDQPFIPQNAVVNRGTNIVSFNGDVGHDHNLVVTNNSTGETVHETGPLIQEDADDIQGESDEESDDTFVGSAGDNEEENQEQDD